jgi:tripartite-type tricarboxylate transporter receptor subunit TctC
MRKSRWLAAVIGLALGTGLGAAPVRADDYPTRPVRIIVGFGPGSVADIMARVVASRVSQMIGQQLVVENRPGAGSSIAAEYVARAPKDGYTLFMATVANTINPAIGQLSFDFAKDLAPVVLVANVPQMMVVHPSLGVNSVQELIALAKAKPEQIQYASSGVGTLSHLSAELLNNAAGIKLMQVPYPGSAQSLNDVIAGRVPLMFGPASTVWSNVQAGQLKVLAVTQTQRAAIAPDVPTMAEAGVPGYAAGIWMGLLASGGTPRPVIEKLARAVNDALRSEDVLTPMRTQGIDPLGGSPDQFAQYIDGEIRKWTEVAAIAKVKR